MGPAMAVIIGTMDSDVLQGTAEGDFIVGDPGAEVPYPAPLVIARSYNGLHADTLWGGEGDDTLIGGVGGDRLHGGPGSDTVILNTDGLWGVEVALGGDDMDGHPWG